MVVKLPFIVALAIVIATPALADPPKVSVLELVDTSLQSPARANYGAPTSQMGFRNDQAFSRSACQRR
jgi:hypothetical protein